VVTRLRCLAAILLLKYSALLHVEQSCYAVTSVLELALTASKGVHMKCANTHAAALLFVLTVVPRHAVSPVHHVSENALDAALMENVA